MTKTSQMGGTRFIVLNVQDQGRNSEDFVKPTRHRLIVLDVQDSEDFVKPTQSHLIVLNVQDQGQIFEDRQAHLKPFDHFRRPRLTSNF